MKIALKLKDLTLQVSGAQFGVKKDFKKKWKFLSQIGGRAAKTFSS